MDNQNPVLTISLLASNRPDTIRKCLDSLRPIREKIPCELILVDTSKSVEIHTILRDYTNQVYEFEWCNDFSKARNVGIKHARGEWFLFLDDDEWFIDSEAIVRFFQSGEYKKYGCANYVVRNYMDVYYSTYSDGYVTRMIRLDKDTEFKGKIHEYLSPIKGGKKDLDALVGHSGYIYETEEKKKAHFKRNYELLLDMIAEEPDNVRWKMQIVQELNSVGDWKELLSFCQKQRNKSIDEIQTYCSVYDTLAFGTFCAGCAQGLLRLGSYEEGICFCEEIMQNSNVSEVLRGHLYFRIAECYYGLSEWKFAEKNFKIYLEYFETLNKNSELIRMHKSAVLLGDAFDESNKKIAYRYLICIGLKQKRVDELCQYYDSLDLDKKVVMLSDEVLQVLFESVVTMDTSHVLVKLVEDAYHNDGLKKYFSNNLLEYVQETVSLENFAKTYARVESDHGDILFAKAYLFASEDERTELKGLYCHKRQVEKEICRSLAGLSYETTLQKFYDYMVGVLEFYLKVCPEEWFEGEMKNLPIEARGAAWLNQMFGRKEFDIEGKIADLRECAKCFPEQGENIKCLAGHMARKRESVANEQLLQMVHLMKEKILLLANQGMKSEALTILTQVRSLAPNDVELIQMEKELK